MDTRFSGMKPTILYSAGEGDDSDSKQKTAPKRVPDMARQLHQHAQEDTPTNVSVPGNWPGLVLWALGRHGPIVLFVFSTWLLYQDNKENQAKIYEDNRESQAQMLEVAKAQIAVNAQVVAQMTEVKVAISQLVEEAKRAHKF